MDEKRCLCCAKKLPLSSFLADASADMRSKVFATCISCCEWARPKRKAAQPSTVAQYAVADLGRTSTPAQA